MGKPTFFQGHASGMQSIKERQPECCRQRSGLPTSMSSGLLSAKKNRKHRGRAAWPAAYLSASQV